MSTDALNLVALADELEAFIQHVVPKCHSVSKYGGRLFTLKPEEKEGQFCGVFVQKQNVQLSFSKGAQVADPKKLLAGSGKFRRHINFKSIEEINENDLKKLLINAAKL